jgi:PAS domain-containing protein
MRLCADRGETYRSDQGSFRRKDGRLIPVSLISSPLREDGELTGTALLYRDISAEAETRVRLRQAEVAFGHLAKTVMVTDADARIPAVNHAFA